MEEQEYQVLLKIVEAEAGGEDTTGKMMVAGVVMNRVRDGYFPNTVTEVVYQTHDGTAQFSPVKDGRIDQVSVSQDTVDAVARVMNGEDVSSGALFFRSVHSKNGWFDRALERVTEHGNHIFYTM
ncbi:MAG: cell wall hydrolase [Eubacteriales bacterium]|nr:cell wall hydrolase [Eubacteriales bacterium]